MSAAATSARAPEVGTAAVAAPVPASLPFKLQHQSFCSLFADAGDFGKESGLSPIDSVFKLIDRDARKECQRDLWTDAGNLDERTEHSAFGECGKTVKKLCILAHDEVRVERELSADFREIAKC